jgi:hypothetical protein
LRLRGRPTTENSDTMSIATRYSQYSPSVSGRALNLAVQIDQSVLTVCPVPARRARRLNSRSAEKFWDLKISNSSTPTMGKQAQIINIFSGGHWTAGFRARLPETVVQ